MRHYLVAALFGLLLIAAASANDIANTTPIVSSDVRSCNGPGELYLYESEDPYNDTVNTTFTPAYGRLLVFTRWTSGEDFWLYQNGTQVPFALVNDSGSPLDARVYRANVTPGVPLTVVGVRAIRDHQEYLSYDAVQGFYGGTLHAIVDSSRTDNVSLETGTYAFLFFDKYSTNRDGTLDERYLTVKITGPGTNTSMVYTQPYPNGTEGAVREYLAINESGTYTVAVNTSDSIYWYETSCPTPVCGNGAIETGEQCDDGNTESGDGCSALCRLEQTSCEGEHYCTEVQASWGGTCPGNPAACLLESGWSIAIGGNLTIGEGNSLIFTGPGAVEDYLPATGSVSAQTT